MKKIHYIILFLLALGVSQYISKFQSTVGYADAAYNFIGGASLTEGNQFTVPAVWNYFSNPASIPTPSHLYWMPLPSIIAALGIKLQLSSVSYFASAQIVFTLVFAFAPVLSSQLTYKFTENKYKSFLVGILTIFSGSYFSYIPSIDSFSILMVIGAILWMVMLRPSPSPFLLGIIAGFIHLVRADGILWVLFLIVFLVINKNAINQGKEKNKFLLKKILLLIGGYLLLLMPWYLRNISLFGTFSPPGNFATLWLTNYDETFSYPASLVSFQNWWNQGIGTLLLQRIKALGTNLISLIVVQGFIFLSPFMAIGIRKHWQNTMVKFASTSLLSYIVLISFLFPFASVRGTFFHSSAIFFPLTLLLSIEGLSHILEWMHKNKGWKKTQPFIVFSSVSVIFAIALSFFFFNAKVINPTEFSNQWDDTADRYQRLDDYLSELKFDEKARAMVVSPTIFSAITNRASVSLPNGDETTLVDVATKFDISIILIEKNHPVALNTLFVSPEKATEIIYLTTFENIHIFSFQRDNE